MKKQNMKTWICKATLAATLTCLALGGATVAQAAGCSNATLSGKYGQTISGELLPAAGTVLPQNGVAMTTFDGKGKFTQVDFVVINGTPTSTNFASETGTYMVNSNCTGKARINYPNGSWIDLELVVVNQGREFHTVVSQLTMGGNPVPVNIGSNGIRVDSDGATEHRK